MGKIKKNNAGDKICDRPALKVDFLQSEFLTVSKRYRNKFGIEGAGAMPGHVVKNTAGWTKYKEQMSKDAADYAIQVATNDLRTQWIKTLNRAGMMERALIDHICDVVEEEIVKPKLEDKKPTMGIDRMDFVLRQLRTAQGKANEYMGGEMDEDSPLDRRLAEQGFNTPTLSSDNIVDVG